MLVSGYTALTPHRLVLVQCFSLLLLGMFLATLATLNFSLALLVGLLASPLSFVGHPLSADTAEELPKRSIAKILGSNALLHVLSPPVIMLTVCKTFGVDVGSVLAEASFGWKVSGLWTQMVICCIWWPAWLVGAMVVSPVL